MITDQGLISLGSAINESLLHIRDLKLGFPMCNGVTDQALFALVPGFIHTLDLSKIIFDFSGCYKITVKSVKALIFEVKKNPRNLKELIFYFPKSSQYGLRRLAEAKRFIPSINLYE